MTGCYKSLRMLLKACKRGIGGSLCEMVRIAVSRNAEAYTRIVHKYLKNVLEAGRLVILSTGSPRHWLDSLQYARREGLVPWGCPVKPGVEKSGKGGGSHWQALFKELALTASTPDYIAPLNVYDAGAEGGVLGVGVVVYAEIDPYDILWSGESCPAGSNPCYAIRWYSLPLLITTRYDVDDPGGLTPVEPLAEFGASAGRKNCAQSLKGGKNTAGGRLVERVVEGLESGELLPYVKAAVSLIAGAAESGGAIGAAGIEEAHKPPVSSWRELLGGGDKLAERIYSRLEEKGVYIEEGLVRQFVELVLRFNVLLAGPPGTGKTLLARLLAEEAGARLIVYTGHGGATRTELIGGPILRGGSVEWRSGVLLEALAAVREGDRVLLLIDEVNRMDADRIAGEFFTIFSSPAPEGWNMDVVCTRICGDARSLGRMDDVALKVCNDCGSLAGLAAERLRVVLTMNTVDYTTVYSVGEALARRFVKLVMRPSLDAALIEREVETAASYTERVYGVKVSQSARETLARLLKAVRRAAAQRDYVTPLSLGASLARDTLGAAVAVAAAEGSEAVEAIHVCKALETVEPLSALVEEEWKESWRQAVEEACSGKS